MMSLIVYLLLSVYLSLTYSQELYSYDSNFGDPCKRSPCGVNTNCEVRNARVYCLCKPGFKPMLDSSQGCEPECQRNSQCRGKQICLNNICVDPCENVACGRNAYCEVISGTGQCTCFGGYTGNPQHQCNREGRELFPSNPCNPNPCGGNTQCRVRRSRPVCSCLSGYTGNPRIKCTRGECETNSHCARHRACVDSYCVDPCYSYCGTGANCVVRSHTPLCSCPRGTEGDPSVACVEAIYDPCDPNPCGENTVCETDGQRILCKCAENFIGSPSTRCRYECETDEHCAQDRMCMDYRCKNPCVDLCGSNARCAVRSHLATCTCPANYQGDPYVRCFPECVQHDDCALDKACNNFKCINPCDGACGINANCKVDNYVAQCSCPEDYVGHPYVSCSPYKPADLCTPNPCGLNSDCEPGKDRDGNDRPVCSCKTGFVGNPLVHCRRGECTSNSDCPNNRACYNYMCEDPCSGNPCGVNAECLAKNHGVVCRCRRGYHGDAIRQCYRRRTMFRTAATQIMGSGNNETSADLCTPNPCGLNAICQPGKDEEGNDRLVCSCKAGMTGDPMVECKEAKCQTDAECSVDSACRNSLCTNPCVNNLCGNNAECTTTHHRALCVCPEGYEGDPFVLCRQISRNSSNTENLCEPNPCGSNADCQSGYDAEGVERPVCSCRPGFTGDPIVDCTEKDGQCAHVLDCPDGKVCTNNTCVDGCNPNPCGENTNCTFSRGILHCECLEGYERAGEAYGASCRRPLQEVLCNPNPCGANADCKAGKDSAGVARPLCYCLPGYTGNSTTGCSKKEVCTTDSDCPDNRLCLVDACEDPCQFVLCRQNTECKVEHHKATCVRVN